MGWKNREIEVKLLSKNGTLSEVKKRIRKILSSEIKEELVGYASDAYWLAPKDSKADFVRLRKTSRLSCDGQITLKSADKGSNLDRVEIDVEVSSYDQALKLMKGLHCEPIAMVTKKYYVYFLENKDTTVSVYKIKNDDRVFVEIEARSLGRVIELVKQICPDQDKYVWVMSSVFNMFVQKKPMQTEDVQSFLGSKI